MGPEIFLLLILALSVVCNWPIYLMMSADPNVVSRRQLNAWIIPEAGPEVRLEPLEYHMETPSWPPSGPSSTTRT